ncbi:MAG: formylglycine-generating enzyme family protein [Elusimicrobia bacterium]|nr:formylglycine-generating enzyme family protein [Elusimicrobiota bacterium]
MNAARPVAWRRLLGLAAQAFLFLPTSSLAATVGNIRFAQDEHGLVRVRYALLDCGPDSVHEVGLSLSSDRGKSFVLVPRTVSGDVGRVRGCGNKEITWNMDKDEPGLSGSSFVFKVTAKALSGAVGPGGRPRLQDLPVAGPVPEVFRTQPQARPEEEPGRPSRPPFAEEPSGRDEAGIQWVTIPGGTLMMGSGSGDEGPVHRVTVKSFQMAKTEVTNKQYKACVDAGTCTSAHVSDGTCWMRNDSQRLQGNLSASFPGDDQPVVCVDWNQAKAFSKWVGGRLPSEAEWEYAALSGGKDRKYPWGNEEPSCERAVTGSCGRYETWPVCSKPAGNTEQGLCDMGGNVWEWTQDWYHGSYNGAPSDGSAWESPTGSDRVFRGGSQFIVVARGFRVVYRGGVDPGGRSGSLGLRVAR